MDEAAEADSSWPRTLWVRLGEQITFNTAHGAIRGGVGAGGMITNDADAICVEGNEVVLVRSGVDFPGGGRNFEAAVSGRSEIWSRRVGRERCGSPKIRAQAVAVGCRQQGDFH